MRLRFPILGVLAVAAACLLLARADAEPDAYRWPPAGQVPPGGVVAPGVMAGVHGTPYFVGAPLRGPAPLPSDVREVRRGLLALHAYAGGLLGRPLRRPALVEVGAGPACLAGSGSSQAAGRYAGGRICLYAAGRAATAARRAQVAAHEAVHALQDELGCLSRGPAWLLEGMADDLAWRAVLDARLASQETAARATLRAIVRPPRRTLSSFEHGRLAPSSYADAHMATLAAEDGEPRRLLTFCEAVGAGTPWRTAFADGFGVGVGAFYGRYEALRLRLGGRPRP